MSEKYESKPIDIRYINGKYYNRNGKTPNKPLTVPYAKRLMSTQKKYGDNVSIKEGRGHDNISQKGKDYKNLRDKKNVKESALRLNETNLKTKVSKLSRRQKGNLRTRFQYGFRILDPEGETVNNPHGSYATDGLINFEYYIDKIENQCFDDNAHGGFHYIVYDKSTREVLYNIEYDSNDR